MATSNISVEKLELSIAPRKRRQPRHGDEFTSTPLLNIDSLKEIITYQTTLIESTKAEANFVLKMKPRSTLSVPSGGNIIDFEVDALSSSPSRHQPGVNRFAARENLSCQGGLALAAENFHTGAINKDAQVHLAIDARCEGSAVDAGKSLVERDISRSGAINEDLLVDEVVADKGLLGGVCGGPNSDGKLRSRRSSRETQVNLDRLSSGAHIDGAFRDRVVSVRIGRLLTHDRRPGFLGPLN
ncbi:hypothetical protein CNMCM5793_008094 [Aspergillus hiratsukae]|uniref:Uncharacterized protein n=1 Tax=Aspergillus hiratsukae TaxID=1194566 RepID=A0A8H6UK70_9EURO|nr:hypothetical protein CNMCM5793_008094 [Aspergillus hiratsukae]